MKTLKILNDLNNKTNFKFYFIFIKYNKTKIKNIDKNFLKSL